MNKKIKIGFVNTYLKGRIKGDTDKVDRWHNSSQIQRWTATGLTDIEPRLHRIKGHGFLKVLRFKLAEIVAIRIGRKATVETQVLTAAN